MYTTDVKPRVGLSTNTGQRGAPAPRMAGGSPLTNRQVVSYESGGTLEERVNELLKKAKEKEDYDKITEANKRYFEQGGTPELSVGGTAAVVDSSIDKTAKGLGTTLSTTGNAYRQRQADDNNTAADAKARGLGQYNRVEGTAGAYRTDSGSAFTGDFWKQAAIADQAQAASLEAQRNNNRISAKTAADAASAADNAYSQRYAAAQAADAQKFASTMQMFGGLTSPGAYKYWGG